MRFLTLTLLFISFVAVGQDYPTKRQLKHFFTNKLDPDDNYDKRVSLTICNTDDKYFREDTVKIYNDDKANWINKCCQLVVWNFDEKRLTFNLTKGTTCTEPSRAMPGQLHEIKIEKKNPLEIVVFDHSGNEVDKFKVIEFKQVRLDKTRPTSKVLILVRDKKPTYNNAYNQWRGF